MWRAGEGRLSVPSAGQAGVFQAQLEYRSGLKIQKRTQGFGPKSKVTSFTASFKWTKNKCLSWACLSVVPRGTVNNQDIGLEEAYRRPR